MELYIWNGVQYGGPLFWMLFSKCRILPPYGVRTVEYAPFSGDSIDHDLPEVHQRAARAVALDRGIARLSRGYGVLVTMAGP